MTLAEKSKAQTKARAIPTTKKQARAQSEKKYAASGKKAIRNKVYYDKNKDEINERGRQKGLDKALENMMNFSDTCD